MQRYAKDSPLNKAIAQGDHVLLQALMDKGANVNTVDMHGFLPIVTAVLHQDRDAFDLLLAGGASICINVLSIDCPKGDCLYSPVGIAVLTGDLEWMEIVIRHGGCIDDQRENWGFPPAMIADRVGNVDAYEYIVSHGAKYRSESMDALVGGSENK